MKNQEQDVGLTSGGRWGGGVLTLLRVQMLSDLFHLLSKRCIYHKSTD